MKKANIADLDALSAKRAEEIRNTEDGTEIKGNIYYVSNDGSDENDGRSPRSPWRTLKRVSKAELAAGDGVLFRRGDLFRGCVKAREGVTYAAYGEGKKPEFYGWDRGLDDPTLWYEVDTERHIWKWGEKILDPGTLVFDHGKAHSRKLIPSYIDGRFVCRNDESAEFDMARDMSEDLDLYWYYEDRLTTDTTTGDNAPIPLLDECSLGDIYLRCDRGNPAIVFESIEALPRRHMFTVGRANNVKIDNLCIKYVGCHAISAGGHVRGLHVTNCEIGWIGGSIQHYDGTDPNYPEGGRGTVTRFGNGVEIYGGCEDYLVDNCYIYQVYDAGVTHQITTNGKHTLMTGVRYTNNLIERCVYAIEYFLDMTRGDESSLMSDIEISGNILRLSGYGWGQQRHNFHTPAAIKGWSYVNRAQDYRINDNIFDRCGYRLLHLVARDESSLPVMVGNTYVQNEGGMLGQFGANHTAEPPVLIYGEDSERDITELMGDRDAEILLAE